MLFGSKTGWVGVDLGTHAVKIAQIRRRTDGFELLGGTIVARTNSWYGRPLQKERPGASVDEIRVGLSAGEPFAGHTSACALPMAITDYQHLQTPATSESQQLQVISQDSALGRNPAGSHSEFDFWATPTSTAGQQDRESRLHIVSLPPGWPLQVVRDHAAAGLHCRVLDALPLAIARAVQMSDMAQDRGTIAAVDWGFSRVTLCMVHNGRPALVRCFREGCLGDLAAAICERLPVSAAEARKLLVEVGLPGSVRGPGHDDVAALVADATRPALDHLQREFQKTFAFWENNQREVGPQVVQLLGGGGTIGNIQAYLSAKLNLPVDVWRLKRSGPVRPAHAQMPDPLLATAIGLSALKGWKS